MHSSQSCNLLDAVGTGWWGHARNLKRCQGEDASGRAAEDVGDERVVLCGSTYQYKLVLSQSWGSGEAPYPSPIFSS